MKYGISQLFGGCMLVGAVLGASPVALGTNITVADGVSSGTGWWGTGGTGAGLENNETEPLTQTDQSWDLEAFVYDDATKKLTIIAGFPLTTANGAFNLGDIFIDSGFDHPVGAAAEAISPDGFGQLYNKDFKYEFAVHWVRDGNSAIIGYDVYQLNENVSNGGLGSAMLPGQYSVLYASNPYTLVVTDESILTSGTVVYQTGLADSGAGANAVDTLFGADVTGLTGGSHNALTIDLTGVFPLQGFHVTLGCGNDNLAGSIPGTPDINVPDTAWGLGLLGTGLAGLALLRRRVVRA